MWGDSAGGYLSAFAGATDGRIRAVVDWYGPIDFARMTRIKRMEGVGIRLFGKTVEEAPGLYAEANPGTHLNRKAPPILIQHGEGDSLIPCDQSTEFAKAYRKAAGDAKVTLELFPGADHLDEQFTTVRNIDRILRFLDEHLKEVPQAFQDPSAVSTH